MVNVYDQLFQVTDLVWNFILAVMRLISVRFCINGMFGCMLLQKCYYVLLKIYQHVNCVYEINA